MSSKKHNRNDSIDTVTRFDVSQIPISRVKTTPQGFLVIPANLTRIGVLEYKRADGTTVKEFRPPEEVFKEDSLNSFSTAPVTEFHKASITSKNVGEHQAGMVLGSVTRSGDFVSGKVLVQRQDTIDKVNAKELIELSPGYTCKIEVSPGVYKGERYDQIQRNIINNHVALLPKGFGRAGSEVALRTDSAYSTIKNDGVPEELPIKEIDMVKITLRYDGLDYVVEVPEALAVSLQSAVAKAENERKDAKASLITTEAELAVAQKALKETQERLDAAVAPEQIALLVKKRASMLAKAQKMAPDLRCDGKTDEEFMLEALLVKGWERETFDGKDPSFLEGIFEATARDIGEPETKNIVTSVGPNMAQKREDGAPVIRTAAQARAEMLERGQNAYKVSSN